MERITNVTPAYDQRNPNLNKNYGIGGMTLRFILKGELGATQFVFYTCQHLKSVSDELFFKQDKSYNPFKGMGADIGYHAKTAQYDGQQSMKCDMFGECFYDGSSLRASEFEDKFLSEGDKAVWEMLESEYIDRFGKLE